MGGIESVIINLANEMSKINDVTVCSIFEPYGADSIYYTRLSDRVKKHHLSFHNTGFSLKCIFSVYNYIRTSKFDVVNLHGFFYYYILSVILLHNRTRFVYTVHSDANMENDTWDRKILFLKKYCFKKGWLSPITISPQSKESFSRLYHIDSKLINNGIPKPIITGHSELIKSVRISQSTKVFIHAGRISLPKNQVVLCEVFQRLINEGFDVVLLIAGTNQDQAIYNQIFPFLNNRIKYIGERNDIPLLLSDADGFCLPSLWEGLPLSLLEALSVGCIPICSPAGGIISVVKDGLNGVISKSPCEDDYYNAVKRYLQFDNNAISNMKEECKQSFLPYDIINTSWEYTSFYKSLIAQ